jgi:predicted metal-dependent hydrolase
MKFTFLMNVWKQHIDGIGEVTFRRSSKSRYLRLSVTSAREVRVSLPVYASEGEGIRFVNAKKQWILKGLEKADKIIKSNNTVFEQNNIYKTKYHELRLSTHPKATIKTTISNGKMNVSYPEYADCADERIQQAIKKAFIEAWRIEAGWYLPKRTKELAEKHGFTFNRIAVRNNKTRWGSCSGKNNINLNLHLMRLPHHLIDYVILHELAHTIHKNHGKSFWAALDKLLGNAKKTDKELNNYRIEHW